jgi:phage terminase large subunit
MFKSVHILYQKKQRTKKPLSIFPFLFLLLMLLSGSAKSTGFSEMKQKRLFVRNSGKHTEYTIFLKKLTRKQQSNAARHLTKGNQLLPANLHNWQIPCSIIETESLNYEAYTKNSILTFHRISRYLIYCNTHMRREKRSNPVEAVEYYIDNPIYFVEDILHGDPTPQQREVLLALPNSPAIAVKSGHGIGKTAIAAWTILWFLTLYPNAIIPCTAPTGHQLDDVLWPEILRWKQKSEIKDIINWAKTRLSLKGKEFENTWFAVPRSVNKSENLQGLHSDNVMFVIDEASGIPSDVMEVVEGALTNQGARLLMIGNPTQLSGTFFNAFHKDRALYNVFTFSAEDSPLVSLDYCERMAKKFGGRDTDIYKVRVLGLFPSGQPDVLIPLTLVEMAMMRELLDTGKIELGVDVARFGDNESVICVRRGYKVDPLHCFYHLRNTELSGRVLQLVKEFRKEGYTKKIKIKVDETGNGSGVVDILYDYESGLNIEIVPIRFGDNAINDEYFNYASEMWGDLKALLPKISLPNDDILAAQLSTRKYSIENGKIRIEPKTKRIDGKYKKTSFPSPDRADALVLSFAAGTGGLQIF